MLNDIVDGVEVVVEPLMFPLLTLLFGGSDALMPVGADVTVVLPLTFGTCDANVDRVGFCCC